jgi:hypothetical protein
VKALRTVAIVLMMLSFSSLASASGGHYNVWNWISKKWKTQEVTVSTKAVIDSSQSVTLVVTTGDIDDPESSVGHITKLVVKGIGPSGEKTVVYRSNQLEENDGYVEVVLTGLEAGQSYKAIVKGWVPSHHRRHHHHRRHISSHGHKHKGHRHHRHHKHKGHHHHHRHKKVFKANASGVVESSGPVILPEIQVGEFVSPSRGFTGEEFTVSTVVSEVNGGRSVSFDCVLVVDGDVDQRLSNQQVASSGSTNCEFTVEFDEAGDHTFEIFLENVSVTEDDSNNQVSGDIGIFNKFVTNSGNLLYAWYTGEFKEGQTTLIGESGAPGAVSTEYIRESSENYQVTNLSFVGDLPVALNSDVRLEVVEKSELGNRTSGVVQPEVDGNGCYVVDDIALRVLACIDGIELTVSYTQLGIDSTYRGIRTAQTVLEDGSVRDDITPVNLEVHDVRDHVFPAKQFYEVEVRFISGTDVFIINPTVNLFEEVADYTTLDGCAASGEFTELCEYDYFRPATYSSFQGSTPPDVPRRASVEVLGNF